MSKIPCEMIQDLFPSYIDELTSEVTNKEIENHMDECEQCREILSHMKSPEEVLVDQTELKEIDFLKETRKATNRKMIACILVSIVLILGILIFTSHFVERPLNSEYVACDISVNDQMVTIKGTVLDDTLKLSKIKFVEEGDTLKVTFTSVSKGFSKDSYFEESYHTTSPVSTIVFDDRIVWADGVAISSITSALFDSAHLYIGDMVANGKCASALNIGGYLGNYTNELQTKEQPYGWKMCLVNHFSMNRKEDMEQRMFAYGCALIAVIDNLDHVTFDYTLDDTPLSYTVSLSEANDFLGYDIKAGAKDIVVLEKLVKDLGLNTISVSSDNSVNKIPSDVIRITPIIFSETTLQGVSLKVYQNGELVASPSMVNANSSSLVRGEHVPFILLPDDFSGKTWEGSQNYEIVVALTNENGEVMETKQSVTLSLEYGKEFYVSVTGDFQLGYDLEIR